MRKTLTKKKGKKKVKVKVKVITKGKGNPSTYENRASNKATTEGGQYYYDEEAANRAVEFFHEYLRHSKGEWAGQPLILEEWQQEEIIKPLFGWKETKSGYRRYRTCWVEVPRKNGKSTLGGGVANYLLAADGEPGAEVYSAAADREQASIVFNAAKSMVDASPALTQRLKVLRGIIMGANDPSVYYKVISSDAFRQHGLNAHGVLFDEVHTQPNRELWDVLTTSTGSRRQPLVFAITTAGSDTDSICYELHEYARQIKEGLIKDSTWLVVMHGAREEEDWTDPKVWKRANPNLGISIKEDYIRQKCEEAKRMPTYENSFRRLHLNQWTSQVTRWIPMRDWDACNAPVIPGQLEGQECWAGLDLSSTTDITALILGFPVGRRVIVLPFFWIPEDNLKVKGGENRASYEAWVRDGYLLTTPGNTIDTDFILKKLDDLNKLYKIKELAFDRWGAAHVSNQMQSKGMNTVQFGQGYKDMSAPCKKLEEHVLSHTLEHGGHPVLRWMADNVVVNMDPAGNLKTNKKESKKKIDGIVALIMSLGRVSASEGKESIYAKRGILTI